jgi:hypothetical protein
MDRTEDRASAVDALATRVDALQAACGRLAADNAQLRASIGVRTREQVADAGGDAEPRGGRPISRAGLLKAAAAGAVVTTLGSELVGPAAAQADGTEGATTFSTSGSVAVSVQCKSPDGTGVDVNGPGTSEAGDYWGVASDVTNGIGVRATSTNGTAVDATSGGTATGATAVLGHITSTSPGGFSSAVRGQNDGTGGLGIGVWGSQAGSGWGGYFTSASGIGVNASGGTGTGVNASGGTAGVTASSAGVGVQAAGKTAGVQAQASSGYGVLGQLGSGPALPSTQAGVAGQASGFPGVAATSDTHEGVLGSSTSGTGVRGTSRSGNGVTASSNGGYGVQAQGGKAQLYIVPAGTAGAPKSGSHRLGEIFLDRAGSLFVCTAAGTPGTWHHINVS